MSVSSYSRVLIIRTYNHNMNELLGPVDQINTRSIFTLRLINSGNTCCKAAVSDDTKKDSTWYDYIVRSGSLFAARWSHLLYYCYI